MKLISVIFPFFTNGSKSYIYQRVISKISQQYPSFIEAVFVDSSKDKALNLAFASLCKQHNHCYVTSEQPEQYSLGKARNDGALAASGKFLFFLDVDFVVSNMFWQHLAATLTAEFADTTVNSKFLMLPCLFLNQQATLRLQHNDSSTLFEEVRSSVLEGDNIHVMDIALTSSTIIVRRDYFIAIGGFSSDYYGHGREEYDLLHRLSLNYCIGQKASDYLMDINRKFPADYIGFRKYFSYYSVPYFFTPLFLLHLYHPRSLFNRFYANKTTNANTLQHNILAYNQGKVLPPLAVQQNFTIEPYVNHNALPDIASYITDIQQQAGYPVSQYQGMFHYKSGVNVKRNPVVKKLRKLIRSPSLFFSDSWLWQLLHRHKR